MPWIRNRPLVGYLGNVGVLSFGCTIVSGSIPLSGISPPNRQNAKPLNPVSTKAGEGHPLLTPGKVMQLPPSDEVVLVSGIHPILAKQAPYYEDLRLRERILPPASLADLTKKLSIACHDGWSALPPIAVDPNPAPGGSSNEDPDNAGIRRKPTLPEHEAIAPKSLTAADPFAILANEAYDGLRAK
jgi:Type IV secretory system Conjugative DNA transfer